MYMTIKDLKGIANNNYRAPEKHEIHFKNGNGCIALTATVGQIRHACECLDGNSDDDDEEIILEQLEAGKVIDEETGDPMPAGLYLMLEADPDSGAFGPL